LLISSYGFVKGLSGDFGPDGAAVGAAGLGQHEGFFCKGQRGRVVKTLAVAYRLMAA